jgi:hypothetical protein
MLNSKQNIDFANYRNETLAYLAGMVASYDQMLVKDLADYKIDVINKLVEQSANPDPKYAISAIKALGEIDGVDAFKKRTELTVQHKSMEEVEKSLLSKLERIEKLSGFGKSVEIVDVEAIDANATETSPT